MAYSETVLYCDSVAYTAVTAWAASTAYTVGQIRRQLATPTAGNERCFVCIAAGTSGGTEPSWAVSSSTKGNKITDNTVTWQECTGNPALCADATSTNAWAASKGSIVLGQVIKNVAASHYFICSTAGTGGTGSEPSWNTTAGSTTADGGVTWTCLGAISGFTTKWAAPFAKLFAILNNNSSWQANAGMTFFVGDDHSETSGNNTYNANSACRVLCVDHTVALPPSSADLKTTAAITISGGGGFWGTLSSGYVYGIQLLFSANPENIPSTSGVRLTFEQCLISIAVATSNYRLMFGSNNAGGLVTFRNCTFSIGAATQHLMMMMPARFEGCTFSGSFWGSTNQIFSGNAQLTHVVCEGCDFSAATGGNLVGQGWDYVYGYFLFKDCKLPSTLTNVYRTGIANALYNLTIDLVRCDSGGTNYRNERHTPDGIQTTATTVARTGGAQDGTTSVSHQIIPTANVNNYGRPFPAIALAASNTVTATNRVVTIYGIANDTRVPTDGEVWYDVEYLGSASSPLGSIKSTQALPLTAAAALTADTSSAWDAGASARANSTAYAAGDVIKLASNPGRLFFCVSAGTSGASENAGPSASIWNTSDKSANVTLSGGNLTATPTSSSDGAVRTNFSKLPGSGKFYFEVSWTNCTGTDTGCGIATSSASLSLIGTSAVGSALAYANGALSFNGSYTGQNFSGAVGTGIVCLAIDLVNNMFWARLNNGNWNNNAGNNPATNTGGINIAALFASANAYPVVCFNSTSPVATANFGATTFTYTVPSGFSAIQVVGSGITFAAAVDGDLVYDGGAVFRAGCRFKKAVTLTSPQPTQAGYIYAYPKFGRASAIYFVDPVVYLS